MLIISCCTMDSVECTGKGRDPCLACRINWSRTDNKYFQRGSARLYQNIASVLAAMEAIKVSCNSICLGTIYCCKQNSEQWRFWKCKIHIIHWNCSQEQPPLCWGGIRGRKTNQAKCRYFPVKESVDSLKVTNYQILHYVFEMCSYLKQ